MLLVVLTSDRGLCGAFNTNINKRAEREWKSRDRAGAGGPARVIGRKGRDYFNRRGAPSSSTCPGSGTSSTSRRRRRVGAKILAPFNKGEVDAIYLVYNEFKSAMTQKVVGRAALLPASPARGQREARTADGGARGRVPLRAGQGRAPRAARADVRRHLDPPRALRVDGERARRAA